MTLCPACATAQPDEAHFCFSCGAPLTPAACASCGSRLISGASFCGECGAPQAGAAPRAPSEMAARPVSSRRVTSVLFGDLVGFTTLSETRDHEETRELLTRYFDECRQVIGRYGGTVEKFIGDAVMAVWGVPTSHEDDAERAVRAGLELAVAVAAMGQDVGVPQLAMRVGIVTGEVAVTIGAEHQGMVAGDAVNTAARVQSVAEPGQVWVDETTRLLTSSAITYLDVGSHHLKGKVEPVPLWSVHAVVASVGGAQRADGLEAPLVGRDRELRLLKELFHGVEEIRHPGLLVLVGEPGLGKSRLGWEFEKYIDGLTTTVRWHSGRCVAYGEGLAFFALAEAIRPRLRALVADDGPEDAAAMDQGRLLELGLEQYVEAGPERDWLRPRLGALLGIGSVGTFPREDLFSAWTVFLERVAGDQPLVLLIDDAQHADDGLLLFLEHLLSVGSFACFVVLLSRPGLLEEHPALATNRRATVSHLAPLSDTDVGALLSGLVVGLPEDVRASLVARSEGVPLFAVETVRSLIDKDLVVPRGGQYVLADPDALDLDSVGAPASLQALISARLDALDPAQRRLVERGSVIGNAFSREEIADLCADLGDVDALLAGLVRQQILSQLTSRFSAEFGQYQFVQSVVPQVAYATLSRRDRRAIHLAVATQTEAVSDPAGDLAPIIAQHYLSAVQALPNEPDAPELKVRAGAQLERAAARARSLGALSDSANHLLLALGLTEDPGTRARLDTLVAWALVDSGDYERAVPHAVAAVDAFDAAGDPVTAGLAAAAHGNALALSGDNAGALSVVEPRWDALVDRPGADEALLPLAKVIGLSSVLVARRDVLDRRLQIAERIGDRQHLAEALNSLGLYYTAKGVDETACIVLLAAADIARAAHHPVALARCLSNLSSVYIGSDLDKAMPCAREAVDTAKLSGVAVMRDYSTANLMLARFASGRWDEIEMDEIPLTLTAPIYAGVTGFLCVTRGEPFTAPPEADLHPDSDDPSVNAWANFAASHQAQAAGQPEEGLRCALLAADGMFELSQASDDYVHMWPVAVDLALEVGDRATVSRLLDVVDSTAERLRLPPAMRAQHARVTGLVARDSAPEEVEPHLRQAIDGFTSWGSPHYRAKAQGELGQWLRSQGRSTEAAPLLEEALTTLTEMRAAAWLEQPDPWIPRAAGELLRPRCGRRCPWCGSRSSSPARPVGRTSGPRRAPSWG